MSTALHARLKRHDWFYEMSDDHGVWTRGGKAHRKLLHDLKKMKCPFETWDIYRAVFNTGIDSPDVFGKQISPELQKQILQWIKEQDNVADPSTRRLAL